MSLEVKKEQEKIEERFKSLIGITTKYTVKGRNRIKQEETKSTNKEKDEDESQGNVIPISCMLRGYRVTG